MGSTNSFIVVCVEDKKQTTNKLAGQMSFNAELQIRKKVVRAVLYHISCLTMKIVQSSVERHLHMSRTKLESVLIYMYIYVNAHILSKFMAKSYASFCLQL